MPYEMILAYVPEYGAEGYSDLDMEAAAKIARQRDLEAADNLLFDCNPDFAEMVFGA